MKKLLKPFYLLLAFTGMMLLQLGAGQAADGPDETQPLAYVIQVKGEIDPAIYDLIHRGIEHAEQEKADVIVLQLETPGGLYESMQKIVQDIMESTVPVATYVSPPGARAASAGTYILYGSHIAAMAPGTNIGAATPIRMIDQTSPFRPPDSSIPDNAPYKPRNTLELKMINDAAAYIRGLAEYRNRNAEWAEHAVREAESISAPEALSKKAIDLMADDIPDLLNKIDGRSVKMAHGQTIRLHTKDAKIETTKADLRSDVLGFIANPNIAFLLLIIGAYGLIYEMFHPGMILPGVIGVIALVLGLFAMNVLPTNYTGLALIFLGIAMMVGEAFVPSFGALGIGGAISFAVGASMLFSGSGDPTMGIDPWLIAGTTLASVGFLSVLVAVAIRAQRRHPTTGMEELMAAVGEIVSWSQGEGDVLITGEVWKASASPEFILNKGDKVKVQEVDGLRLIVKPA